MARGAHRRGRRPRAGGRSPAGARTRQGRRPDPARPARVRPPRRADAGRATGCGCATSTRRTERWWTASACTSRCCTAARRSASARCGSRCWPRSPRSPARRPPSRRAERRRRPESPSWSMIGRLVDTRARRGRRLTYAALAVAGVAAAAVARARADRRRRAGRGSPAVVRNVVPATFQVEARATAAPSGLGSAWVLDRDAGLLVTAAHVINSGQRFFVRTEAGEVEAQVVGAAPCEDLAVLRVRAPLGRPGARASATPTRARPCSRSASRRAPSRTSRRPRTAASCPPRTRSFADPGADVPAYAGRDPHRHRARPGLLGRAAGGSRRPRRRGQCGRAHGRRRRAPLQSANYAVTARRARDGAGRRSATGARSPRSASTSAIRIRTRSTSATCRRACSCAARCRARAARARGSRQRPDRGRQRPRDRTYALRLVRRDGGDRERTDRRAGAGLPGGASRTRGRPV